MNCHPLNRIRIKISKTIITSSSPIHHHKRTKWKPTAYDFEFLHYHHHLSLIQSIWGKQQLHGDENSKCSESIQHCD